MERFDKRKRRGSVREKKSAERVEELKMGRALSLGDELVSLFTKPDDAGVNRSQEYTPVAMGKPVVIRDLSFFLVDQGAQTAANHDIMVSTFTKTEEVKEGAAEAVNFFNENHSFSNGRAEIRNWGGRNYGQELINYSKSYYEDRWDKLKERAGR